ncbi:hypothetical protein HYPSUDRAFT_553890 [Hypholoma sublateritium FD-334 SS-4]|uniref:Uncharacterized protein n=1 Tax=Hypholoma sublateritium (strain FD-334 SS-4) TaxID=945553 RepID=A0A0D2PXF8_HYPSF|nr:hypothetical protein HYPSUDRAFT_553890 [Hypholoma sublateritium FD-334 SS-4]
MSRRQHICLCLDATPRPFMRSAATNYLWCILTIVNLPQFLLTLIRIVSWHRRVLDAHRLWRAATRRAAARAGLGDHSTTSVAQNVVPRPRTHILYTFVVAVIVSLPLAHKLRLRTD